MHVAEQAAAGTEVYASVAERGRQLRDMLRDPLMWFVAAGAIFLIANSLTLLTMPLSHDEGTFLIIAQEVLHGRLPYRDVVDQKAPAIYYLLAAFLAVTRPLALAPATQALLIRGGVVLVNLWTATGIVLLGRRWWRLEVGVLAAGLWLAALPLIEGGYFVTEPFAVAATIGALVVTAYRPGVRAALAAGLLLALGTLFKQTAILAAPGVVLMVLREGREEWSWRMDSQLVRRGVAFLIGLVAPWLLVFAVWAAAGGLNALWDDIVISDLLHYPPDPARVVKLVIARDALPLLWLTPVVVGLVGLARWSGLVARTRRAPSMASVALWLIGGLGLIPFSTHAFLHYWVQVVPFAALLTALGVFGLLDAWRPPTRSSLASRLAAPLLLALLVTWVGWHGTIPDRLQANGNLLHRQIVAAQWIASHTTASESILVAPSEPEYYFLAERPPSISNLYVLPINVTPALIAQLEGQLASHAFGAVIWQEGGMALQPPIPAIYAVVTAHYRLVATEPAQHLELWEPTT
jgi:hypothetical protein